MTIGPGGNATTARLELSNNVTLPNAIALSLRNNSTVAIQNISGNNALSGTVTGGWTPPAWRLTPKTKARTAAMAR